MARPAVTDGRVLDLMAADPSRAWTVNELLDAVGDKSKQQIHRTIENLTRDERIVALGEKGPHGAYQYRLTEAMRGETTGRATNGSGGVRMTIHQPAGIERASVGVELGSALIVTGLKLEAGARIIVVEDAYGQQLEIPEATIRAGS